MGSVTPDWLTQLAPAHAPAPPGWWPPAPGWWVLALLLVLSIGALALWHWRPNARLRRAALCELAHLEMSLTDDVMLAGALQHLVRRYAVARFGRETVAALIGPHWIAFVVAHGGHAWDGESGRALLQAAYGGASACARERWLAGARGFFKARS